MDQGISPDKNLEPNESAGVTQENSPETIVDEFATQETAYDNNPASILDGKDNAGAYAILYDDGDLIIQRGNTYDAGKQSSGIGVIAVYTGFEGDENNPHAFTKNGEEYGLWNRYSNNDENELPLIKTIKATSAIQAPASLGGFFYGAENATSADLANLDVSNTTEMFNVFYNCANLVDLNISGWDTSEVTNMSAMFYGCSFLETVDLSGFNTTNVSDMSFMFFGCVSIEELDLSNFKTENLTYTNSMFANMPMLRHIDISGFAISEAAFTDAFWECSLIETITIGEGFRGGAFPRPSSEYIVGATGEWYDSDGNSYAFDQIPTGIPATYYSYNPVQAGSDKTNELDGSHPDEAYAIMYRDGTLIIKIGNTPDEEKLEEQVAVVDYYSIPAEGTTWSANRYSNDAPWKAYTKTIRKVICRNSLPFTSLAGWFTGCISLKSVDFTGLDGTSLEDMSFLFCGCDHLIDLNTAGMNASHVKNMAYLFCGCPLSGAVDFSALNGSNPTNMEGMFWNSSVQRLDLSHIDVSQVTNMSHLFHGCTKLKTLILAGWDTRSLVDMSQMFTDCSALTALDLSSFNTSHVMKMCNSLEDNNGAYPGLFAGCQSLVDINFSGDFDTSNVENMNYMFYGCGSLKSLDLSSFNTSQATSMVEMFAGCKSLNTLDVSNFDTSRVTDMSEMFCGMEALEQLDLSGFNWSNVEHVTRPIGAQAGLFGGCLSLRSLNLPHFNTSKVSDMTCLFSGCESLVDLNLSDVDTSAVTDMDQMFCRCSSLTSLNLSEFDTSNVKTFGMMFFGCSSLKTLNLTSFDTSAAENISGMFWHCTSLESLDLAGFDTSDLSKFTYMPGEDNRGIENDSDSEFSTQGDSRDTVTNKPKTAAASDNYAIQSSTYLGRCDKVFEGCDSLYKVSFGDGFNFKDPTLFLPKQSTKTLHGSDGKWYTKSGTGYIPSKVPSMKRETYYAAIPITAAQVSGLKDMQYTGKNIEPKPFVKVGASTLVLNKDYTLSYVNNRSVGTASIMIRGAGKHVGSKTVTFKIKKKNPMKLSGKRIVVKSATLKTKTVSIAAKNAITVKNGKGKVTYKKVSGNKKITMTKKGTVNVKKGLKKGTYKVKAMVTAAGTNTYLKASKKVTFIVSVR